jgi:SP family facilitated glucose transporter-like MFS transporter 3
MSTSGFQTIIEEIQRTNAKIKLSRSSSVGADMKPSLLNPLVSSGHTRRALYGTLPFMAAFGMQHRETEIRRVLSNTSLQAMSDAGSGAGAGAGAGPTGSGGERQLLLDAIDVDEIIITFPLVMSSFVAIISQFLIGFHTGAMNGPAKVVFPGHTTWEWSLAVSAFAVGGPFGALAGGFLANRRGRRGAMMINTWVFLLGGLLLACAPSVHWLVPARLAVGFASGLVRACVVVVRVHRAFFSLS